MKIISSDRQEYFKSVNERFFTTCVKDSRENFQEGQLQREFSSRKECLTQFKNKWRFTASKQGGVGDER